MLKIHPNRSVSLSVFSHLRDSGCLRRQEQGRVAKCAQLAEFQPWASLQSSEISFHLSHCPPVISSPVCFPRMPRVRVGLKWYGGSLCHMGTSLLGPLTSWLVAAPLYSTDQQQLTVKCLHVYLIAYANRSCQIHVWRSLQNSLASNPH